MAVLFVLAMLLRSDSNVSSMDAQHVLRDLDWVELQVLQAFAGEGAHSAKVQNVLSSSDVRIL